jgi:Na+/H+ antiporter NhaD/arsenite permease-like protein
MENVALVIFLMTYAGVAVGGIPGLALDRTGIALLGAIAMVACGVIAPRHAVAAIDIPTILLLYALMVVAAQFRLSGFYTRTALLITRFSNNPKQFLCALMTVSALLSAVLTNDIVCLAFTPVLCSTLLQSGINPLPSLIGLACASNIGSAATIIGNPQNMLLGQVGRLDFAGFTAFCWMPALGALAAAYGIIVFCYRNAFALAQTPEIRERRHDWPVYNHHQACKGMIVTALLLAMFFTPIPREVSALACAGVLLCSRNMRTRSILGLVDWHLITLFCALFIIIAGIEITRLPATIIDTVQRFGVDMQNPFSLTLMSVLLGNIVSNVPATMLLVKFLNAAEPLQWYVVGLASTLAGNLITIGSIANLIVIESARPYGISISFKEHARVGIPVTIASLLIAMAWLALRIPR